MKPLRSPSACCLLFLALFLAASLPQVGYADPGLTSVVSVSSAGEPGNFFSIRPALSADGRSVAFVSIATNLVEPDLSPFINVFVHDRLSGMTILADNPAGEPSNGESGVFRVALSEGGRWVVFDSFGDNLVKRDKNRAVDVFAHDLLTGVTRRMSLSDTNLEGNSGSTSGVISDNGRFVAFHSFSTNLVKGDTNNTLDIFVRDRDPDGNGLYDQPRAGRTVRVSVSSAGEEGDDVSFDPAISGDGRSVAFISAANTLVPDDTNGESDVFVHDRETGTTMRVSVASDGTESNSFSQNAALNQNGRYVAFRSDADNLVPDDTNGEIDVFVHYRETGTTTRVSVNDAGEQGNGESFGPVLSADGRFLAFSSFAGNLVPDDTNGVADVFVRDLLLGTTTRVNVSSTGEQANGQSVDFIGISADGLVFTFGSAASNLVPGVSGAQIYVHDRR